MKLTTQQKQQLTQLLKTYPISVAYLFGSQAHGSAGVLSDVDIAVLFEPSVIKKEQKEMILSLYGELTSLLGSDEVDVVNLSSAPILLRHRAVFRGIPLFVRNQKEMEDYSVNTVHQYEDFRYHLNTQKHLIRDTFLSPQKI